MSSTADILMYKQAISTNDKQAFDFQWIDAISDGPVKENLKILSGTIVNEDVEPTSINKETKINPNSLVDTFRQSSVSQNVQVRAQPNMVNLGINSTLNSLNLYDAHFSSRLSMLITDQVINGTENFELQLEPESFGKVRINVSLESSNVDVKMVAENSAAVLALRGSENILQNIAEQNGLKLSDYSVDMQNNQNGENSKRKNLGDEGEVTKSENNKSLEENALALNADNTYKLNLLA
jgi:flagellar hook-length control protein FliK